MQLPDGESIIGKTFRRAADLLNVENILAVTNQGYFFRTREEFEKSCDGIKLDFVLEPFGKNTAPAIAAAAFRVKEQFGEDAVMLVLPADHLIPHQDIFQQAVDNAVELAERNFLVTFGIEPTHPETGFGYIEKGSSISESGFKVSRFVEKPDLAKAQEYLDSGRFVWNSGMFCFTASAFLKALEKSSLKLFQQVRSCWNNTVLDKLPIVLDQKTLRQVEGDSIDYAVMEKADNVAVVSAVFEWNDIGSWAALADVYAKDEGGNVVDGDVIAFDVENCLVDSKSRLSAVIGIKNIVVVNDEDVTLVVNKDRVQDVKKVVERLKADKRHEYKEKKTTRRPWGSYTNLIESENYKVKRIVVFPGQSLSLQKHLRRSEHWTVVSGTAEVVNDVQMLKLEANQSTYIEKGAVHRLSNVGSVDLELIEVQYGDYLGEDDIIRLEDNYGRV